MKQGEYYQVETCLGRGKYTANFKAIIRIDKDITKYSEHQHKNRQHTITVLKIIKGSFWPYYTITTNQLRKCKGIRLLAAEVLYAKA